MVVFANYPKVDESNEQQEYLHVGDDEKSVLHVAIL